MGDTTYESFIIDYEEEDFSSSKLIQGKRIRSRVRIFVGSVCLTNSDGQYTVSDFLPYNCTKLLQGIKPLLDGESHRVPFTDSVCDLEFSSVDDEVVVVNAYAADQKPRNSELPQEGLPVKRNAVINEIISSSRKVKRGFESIEEIEFGDDYQDFVEALSNAEDTISNYDIQLDSDQ